MKSTDIIKLINVDRPMLTVQELTNLGVPQKYHLYYRNSYIWNQNALKSLNLK